MNNIYQRIAILKHHITINISGVILNIINYTHHSIVEISHKLSINTIEFFDIE